MRRGRRADAGDPRPAQPVGQAIIGVAHGLYFTPSVAREVLSLLAAASAVLLATLSGLPVATVVLATAPGGTAEMCVMAKVLQLGGVPLVTAAHVTRVIVLISTTATVFRLGRGAL